MKTKIFRILTLIAALSMLAAPVGARPIQPAVSPAPDLTATSLAATASDASESFKSGEALDGIYLIRLEDAPVATYQGGIQGLAATNPGVLGEAKLDAGSSAAQAYKNYLAARQDEVIARIGSAVGHPVEVVYRYYTANNGLAARLTADEAALVARLPGVVFVQPDVERELHTDAGPTWIGADSIWNGTATGGLPGTEGEGIIVGVIDTGINPSNPSFADPGPVDGYDHSNPLGSFVGVCDSGDPTYDPSFPCNDKLIGARGYATVNGGDPTDFDGHGSHTASTAAGNVVTATVTAPTTSTTTVISGVAPHANIIAYGACCTLSALTAAIDDIVTDGVDVVNYSIGSVGCTASDPWNDFDAVGFLNARAAGIFVATSAGNCGPGADTVGSPADVPWLTSVGASTHNRAFLNSLINMSGVGSPPADIAGRSLTSGYGPAPIVYAGDFGDPLCAPGAFPAGTWTSGEIVVCDRGTYGRVEKGQSVLDGGAGGYVLANTPANGFGVGALNGDSHVLPAVHITAEDGTVLKAWLASGSGHMATIAGSSLDISASHADIVAGFSSRGGNKALADILVPSVAAPGVDIIAAEGTNDAVVWDVLSGTSMASPHTAGAGALLKALHPEWTPAQIQSALMTTASTMAYKTDGATPADPFDIGSGRIELDRAGEAGFVLDETLAGYQNADPDMGGDPKSLNLASFGNAQCLESCSWTRVISSTMSSPVTWTVSTSAPSMTVSVQPTSIMLSSYATATITVTADVSGAPQNQWLFGQVTMTPDTSATHPASFPVAVQATTGVLPGQVEINTRRDAGSQTVSGLQSIEITDLTIDPYGLTVATLTTDSLSEDPTNGDPYDNLNDGTTFYITTTVPSAAERLVAETTESTAVDIDLFVGTGGTPSAASEVCSSTTPTASEYCNVTDPAAGTWWILVQNWDESASPPDSVTLASAVVPGSDAGNMTVTGPSSVPAGTSYDLQVFWDEPLLEAGGRAYGAFDIGSSPGSPGDVGTLPVDLNRHEDDVQKTVSDSSPPLGATLTYTLSVQPSVTGEQHNFVLTDTIPTGLDYITGTATASSGVLTVTGNTTVNWTGTDAIPTEVVAVDAAPFGYVSLASLSVAPAPCTSACDETILTIPSGLDFYYLGQHYTSVEMISNGFIVPGGGASGMLYANQDMPDATAPNNVIAPFWTDIDMDGGNGIGGGIWYVADVTDGVTDWHVFEWEDAEQWNDPSSFYTFQIWIEEGTDKIWFVYDDLTGNTSTASVGFEDSTGTSGDTYYYDGTGTLPTPGVDLGILLGSADPVIISYQVTAPNQGMFTNIAEHLIDNPGAQQASASATVSVGNLELYLPLIVRNN